ncbi:hypothetical protein E2C01_055040 [Portunus trituberculatus]|uniref:Uncharacterized protein n=1 Tax=Portunus trituberculatus TaxID=210409 RepID=A0A5B7GVI8_PORTR|nr:hypothetical protein [Portunus trituberculatus]
MTAAITNTTQAASTVTGNKHAANVSSPAVQAAKARPEFRDALRSDNTSPSEMAKATENNYTHRIRVPSSQPTYVQPLQSNTEESQPRHPPIEIH